MRGFGDIKFVGDKISEQTDLELGLDNDNIEIDGDVYKLCGYVFTCRGYNLYFVKGNILEESEHSGTDEIMNWDGKYFMRWKPGTELKLERDKHELEDILQLSKRKVFEVILTQIKSVKDNFSE